MEAQKAQKYADLLVRSVLKEVDEIASPFDYPQGNTKRINNYIIDMDIFDNEVMKPLLDKEQWERKFSDSYVEKKLRNILLRVFNEDSCDRNSRALKYFAELVVEIENYNTEQIIYLPLSNIELLNDSLKLGPITLIKITEELYNELAKHIVKLVIKSDQLPEQQQQIIERYLGYLKDGISARYTCIADDDRAVERAKEEGERVLDLLRFAMHKMGQDHLRIAIGLRNEVSRYIQSIPVFSKDGQHLYISNRVVGPLTHFQIGTIELQRMEEIGIFDLADILEHGFEMNSFYESLFRGLRWFARGQMPQVKENRFLNFITCLELLLTTRATRQSGNTVATGVAVILSNEQLKKKVKELYSLRNRISHGGYSAMHDSDLEELRDITGNFLMRLIQRRDDFQTCTELQKWITSQTVV